MSVYQGDFLEKIAINFGRDFLRCRQIVTRRGGGGSKNQTWFDTTLV